MTEEQEIAELKARLTALELQVKRKKLSEELRSRQRELRTVNRQLALCGVAARRIKKPSTLPSRVATELPTKAIIVQQGQERVVDLSCFPLRYQLVQHIYEQMFEINPGAFVAAVWRIRGLVLDPENLPSCLKGKPSDCCRIGGLMLRLHFGFEYQKRHLARIAGMMGFELRFE